LLEGYAFPDRRWNDAVVVTLLAWAEAVLRILTRRSTGAEVRFMDGPYLVALSTDRAETWRVELFETGRHKIARGSHLVDRRLVRSAVVVAAARTLAKCSEHYWWSPDIDRLIALHDELVSAESA
jgi:hypothetical protein